MTLPSGKSMARADFEAMIGQEIGVSSWFVITQDRIDTFADCTEDWQYIHVDPEKAKESPFGTTIAHGFLTMSMLSAMIYEMPSIEGGRMGVNYGFNRVRFVSPVKVGARIRARFVLTKFEEIRPGEVQTTMDVAIEIEGETKPALVAEWLGRRYF
jgi:acyl dehydratase